MRAVQPSSSGSTVCIERQRLAESKDWVEGLRAAADTVRQQGNITLAKALDSTAQQPPSGIDRAASHPSVSARGATAEGGRPPRRPQATRSTGGDLTHTDGFTDA